MNESSISDNESSYRAEYLRRKNRLANGEIKGYYRYFDQSEPNSVSDDQEIASNFAPPVRTIGQKSVIPNSLANHDELLQENLTVQRQTSNGGGFGAAPENMVGYYNVMPCQGSIRAARATVAQTPPKVTLDPADLTPLDRIPSQLTDSATSLLSSSSFKVSQNSAFTPVQRSVSVERCFDTNSRNVGAPTTFCSPPSTIAESTLVFRNINGPQHSRSGTFGNEQPDNNNNNQKLDQNMVVWPKTTSSLSTMRDDSTFKLRNDFHHPSSFNDHATMKYDHVNNTTDNLAISRFARKDLFSPNKSLSKPNYGQRQQLNGPRLLQEANSTIAAAYKKDDTFNNSMTLPSVMRSAAIKNQKVESSTNGLTSSYDQNKIDSQPEQKQYIILSSNKFEAEPSSTNHQTFPKRITKKLFDNQPKIENENKIEQPFVKIGSTEKLVDNLSRWQHEQNEYRKQNKQRQQQNQQPQMQQQLQNQKPQLQQQHQNQQPHQVPINAIRNHFANQDRIENYGHFNGHSFNGFLPGSSEIKKQDNSHFNVHRQNNDVNHQPIRHSFEQQNEQNKKFNHQQQQSVAIIPIENPPQPVGREPYVSDISFQSSTDFGNSEKTAVHDDNVAVDVLKSGNVGAKTKLFETLAKHEKTDVDDQATNKPQNHSFRRKTERSKTIHTTFRRPITPDDEEREMFYFNEKEALPINKQEHFPITKQETFITLKQETFPIMKQETLPIMKQESYPFVKQDIFTNVLQEPSTVTEPYVKKPAAVAFDSSIEEERTSKNQTPPSPSEDGFEDEKSKLTLSEKAKFFEIKSQESKNRAKRFQQRHKTQPVTQQHRSRSRTKKEEVVKARTIMTDRRQSLENDEINESSSTNHVVAPNNGLEPNGEYVSKHKISNVSIERGRSKAPVVVIKPRKTVFLHTESNGLRSSSHDDTDENSISNGNINFSKQHENDINGYNKPFSNNDEDAENDHIFAKNRLIIKIHPNNLICDNHNVNQVGHKNVHIKDNSSDHNGEDYNDIYALLFDDSQSLRNSSLHRKNLPPLFAETFNTLRESEL